MEKLSSSQAKFFHFADCIYDSITSWFRHVLNSISQQPKVWFRAFVLFVTIAGAYAILIGIGDVVASEIASRDFMNRHSKLFEAMRTASSDPTYRMPYTAEQRAVAFKMLACHPRRGNGEIKCAGDIIADAAITGGEQRAIAVKSTLQELNFKVPNWL